MMEEGGQAGRKGVREEMQQSGFRRYTVGLIIYASLYFNFTITSCV